MDKDEMREKMKGKMKKKKGEMKGKMHHEKRDVVFEMETDKNLDEAIASLEENLKDHSFGVLWQMNFKDTFEKKGMKFDEDFVILEVCNPERAKSVLEINKHVGYILPCKIVVRTENDKTFIGMADPEKLIGLFEGEELDQIATEVKARLKEAIEASV